MVFGIFHSFLAASLAVKEAELVLMPTACPLLKCNKFTEIFVRRRLYVLNMSKTPATQPSMADSQHCFVFSTFAKAYGINVRCLYAEHVEERIVNLGNILGTH